MVQKEEEVILTRWQKIDQSCRAFANFFYNKQTKQVMGRSKASWGKIGLFYFLYYGFLAGFFVACLSIFLSTLNEPGKGGPSNIDFLHGDSAPGLNVVVDLKGYNSKLVEKVAATQKYLDGFNDASYGIECSIGGSSGSVPCKFNQTLLGECSGLIANNQFGLDNKKPCAFVKINKVYGWMPKNRNSAYLKLSCFAEGGTVEVKPEGFLISAFPFKGDKFYQTPPVAVIVSGAGKVTVSCALKGEKIKVSESYIASRAFGKVKFVVEA